MSLDVISDDQDKRNSGDFYFSEDEVTKKLPKTSKNPKSIFKAYEPISL
jgi:hypothetical protein